MFIPLFFFLYCHGDHRDLHSFPTRRSSDLAALAFWDRPTLTAETRAELERFAAAAIPIGLREWELGPMRAYRQDRKSTRLNSSHSQISYAVFCLKKKKTKKQPPVHTSKLP